MIYTLFLWTVVATKATGSANYTETIRDWRPIAEITNIRDNAFEECVRVAAELNISKERYRCIRTK